MMHRPRATSGFTFVEVLMALAVTAMIGLTLATMTMAFVRSTAERTDLRSNHVHAKLIQNRLEAAIRSSRAVLAEGSGYLVLWMNDADANNQVNISELRRIERTAGGSIVSYKGHNPATDTAYALNSDFNSVSNGLKGQAYFPSETWATGVSALSFTLNHATDQSASHVEYVFTLSGVKDNLTVRSGVALRKFY